MCHLRSALSSNPSSHTNLESCLFLSHHGSCLPPWELADHIQNEKVASQKTNQPRSVYLEKSLLQGSRHSTHYPPIQALSPAPRSGEPSSCFALFMLVFPDLISHCRFHQPTLDLLLALALFKGFQQISLASRKATG